LLASCSSKSKESAARADAKVEPAAAIQVSTAPVVERSTNRGVEVVGSLEAQDEVTISSQASGNLESISVDLGSPVSRGQVIARIDQRELKLKRDQAEAALHQAEAKLGITRDGKIDPQKQPDVRQAVAGLERARYDLIAAKKLFDAGTISNQQYDVYQKTVDQAEARYQASLENVRNLEGIIEEKRAALDLTKKQLADSDIISPLSGVVKEKTASRGEYLQPGKPVVTIVQINPLRLRLEVPETFAASIAKGQVVTLKVDSFADREFKGVIKRINPSMDEKSRSLMAEAEVANPNALLRPGMFARSQIVSNSKTMALMVPEKAVVSLAGVTKIFILEGSVAVERIVQLGARDGSLVEILEGVKPGERVITSNAEQLHDGSAVAAG
ncbi:MAG TPA: efflux RND transporter periplasmic adaptor subunit, partial [Blastocatellia bacterium]|nr:efflux RND transporter periplasmic adaptor subunit [Blastocatellia bacterium]